MANQPLIGITCDFEEPTGDMTVPRVRLNIDYAQRIAEAGGLPVALPLTGDAEAFTDRLDGLLIPGGNDINPREFGGMLSDEELAARNVIILRPERFQFEKRLYAAMRKRGKPILGICLGCQMVNVGEGGTLMVDLPHDNPQHGKVDHRWHGRPELSRHEVEASGGSLLAEATGGGRFEIVTSHHQAVREPGFGLRVSARADDGIIEAVEATDGSFVLGVQWHPERQPDSPQARGLFEALVEAARTVGQRV